MTDADALTRAAKFARAIEDADDIDLPALVAGLEDILAWRPMPHQVPPDGDWFLWLLLGGRYAGKTDACAAYMTDHVAGPPCLPGLPGGHRMSIIAPTLGDAVDSCVNGPSGLVAHDPTVRLVNAPGGLIVRWPTGAEAKLFGAYRPPDVERLRAGGNRCLSWLEEFMAWVQLADSWVQMTLGTRLGRHPRAVGSTTPKPRALLTDLVSKASVWRATPDVLPSRLDRIKISRGHTADNVHADPDVIASFYDAYGGTRLGRQELAAELLDDFEGALWQRAWIDADRVPSAPRLTHVAVGIDPSTWGPDVGREYTDVGHGIETGIVAVGIAADRQVYVLEDLSGRYSPEKWARRAADAYHRLRARAVVPEINAGGALVTATIRLVDDAVRIDPVRAAQGKRARAEPVAALYEQHRAHHVGNLPVLEDQMCFAAGTVIACRDGDRPIEDVQVGDAVWTRGGWRRVRRAGWTGRRLLVRVRHAVGCVLCTEDHSIWVEGRRFVSAATVRLGDRLAVDPRRASTATLSRGEDVGGTGCRAATIGTDPAIAPATARASSFTGPSTRPTSGRSLMVTTSTTATATRPTTSPRISPRSHPSSTTPRTVPAAGPPSTPRLVPDRAEPYGRPANHGRSSALTVVRHSSPPECGLVSVPVVAVEPLPEMADVYDLTVDDAHEFLADGVLVHNCGWDPSESWSPDRIDALVWAVWALKPWVSGRTSTSHAAGLDLPSVGGAGQVGELVPGEL